MTIQTFACNPFETNCYVCHAGGEAAVVDPSCQSEAEIADVLGYIEREELTVRHLLLTHAHIDHIFGCAALARALDLPVRLHRADLPLYNGAVEQGRMFGVPVEAPPAPGAFLEPGDEITFGGAVWTVRHTLGHSPGSVSFVDAVGGYVIAGDALFAGSIGRTDLWGGSLPVLLRAIEQELLTLPDETVVYPGHYEATTIGRERRTNPYLTGGFAEL